jgi:hypothetical protein
MTLLVAVLVLAAPAQGGQMLSLSGHAWETGGFPPSAHHSYTWHLRDGVSLGETVLGSMHFVNYANAAITFYVDDLPANHSFGTFPPNVTAPATFVDGTSVYLHGEFATLNLSFDTFTQAGSFAGDVTFDAGEVFTLLHNTHGLSSAATFGGISPQGYDLRLVGSFFLEALAVEESSWGRIKAHYR